MEGIKQSQGTPVRVTARRIVNGVDKAGWALFMGLSSNFRSTVLLFLLLLKVYLVIYICMFIKIKRNRLETACWPSSLCLSHNTCA
jgi:hypothetical protein